MSDLIALAERVEALTGPCRETDRAIRDALGLPNDYSADWGARGREVPAAYPYTASLDAAMSLVPEGWRNWTSDSSVEGWTRWMLAGPRTQWVVNETGEREAGNDWYQQGVARTPALALTAAALLARAALEEGK